MTVAEAAKILEVKPTVVYDLCARRLLGHMRVGIGRGTIRISREDLDAYIASRRVEPVAAPPRLAPRGAAGPARSIIGEELAKKARREAESAARRRAGGRS